MWAWFSSSLAKLKLDDIPWIAARVQPHSSCAKSKIDMVTLLSCRAQGISQSYAQHVHQGAWLYSYSLFDFCQWPDSLENYRQTD